MNATLFHWQKEKSHISRLGSKKIRKTLYMSSLVVKNCNPDFANFMKRLEKQSKYAKVIIVAFIRKLTHIFFCILKNGAPFDENLTFKA